MAESRRESAELGHEDGREERLESQENEEAAVGDERPEPEEVEDEEERKEREEYKKQLAEILSSVDAREASEAEAAGDDYGQAGASSAEAEENATPRTPAPAQLAAATAAEQPAALSAGAPTADDQSSAPEQHELQKSATDHSPLTTGHTSALAKTDNRSLARREDGLSVAQHRALAMLAQGLTIPQAAMKAGIGRTTLYRWTRFDARFRAAYNTWKQEQRESCRAALLKCADAAVARIARRVEHDEELAFKVVKELGLFKDSEDSATTDPELVQHEIEIHSLTTERSLQRRHLLALCEKGGVTEHQAKAYFDWKKREAGSDKDAQTRERVDSATARERRGDAAREDFSPTQHSAPGIQHLAADDDEDDDDFLTDHGDDEDELDEDELEDEEAEDEDDGTEGGSVPPLGGLKSLMQTLMRHDVNDDK